MFGLIEPGIGGSPMIPVGLATVPLTVDTAPVNCSWVVIMGVNGLLPPAGVPNGVSTALRDVSLWSEAESLRAIWAAKRSAKVTSSGLIASSNSLRNLVIRAWLQTSGCLATTVPRSRMVSWMWSIIRATCVNDGGAGSPRMWSNTPASLPLGASRAASKSPPAVMVNAMGRSMAVSSLGGEMIPLGSADRGKGIDRPDCADSEEKMDSANLSGLVSEVQHFRPFPQIVFAIEIQIWRNRANLREMPYERSELSSPPVSQPPGLHLRPEHQDDPQDGPDQRDDVADSLGGRPQGRAGGGIPGGDRLRPGERLLLRAGGPGPPARSGPPTGSPPRRATPNFTSRWSTPWRWQPSTTSRRRWGARRCGATATGPATHDDAPVLKLRVYPHALREANAYYSPEKKALLFGYFPAALSDGDAASENLPGGLVFTCLSHDVVAHETTHALLDGLHRYYSLDTGPDSLAFHEAFADIVALFQHFSQPAALPAPDRQDVG